MKTRTPILLYCKRMPIILTEKESTKVQNKKNTKSKKVLEKLKTYIEENSILVGKDSEILKIAKYYEYKCRKALSVSAFKALSKDYKNHKNWIHFERIYDLCKENKFNYKAYIDSQFERMFKWKNKSHQKYPYPNQMYSESAIKAYEIYCKEYTEEVDPYRVENKIVQPKGEEILSLREELRKVLEHDYFIFKLMFTSKSNDDTPKEIQLAEKIADVWVRPCSGAYLSQFPWMLRHIQRKAYQCIPDPIERGTINRLNRLRCMVRDIQKNKNVMKIITELVEEIEENLDFEMPVNQLMDENSDFTKYLTSEDERIIKEFEEKYDWIEKDRVYERPYSNWGKGY